MHTPAKEKSIDDSKANKVKIARHERKPIHGGYKILNSSLLKDMMTKKKKAYCYEKKDLPKRELTDIINSALTVITLKVEVRINSPIRF